MLSTRRCSYFDAVFPFFRLMILVSLSPIVDNFDVAGTCKGLTNDARTRAMVQTHPSHPRMMPLLLLRQTPPDPPEKPHRRCHPLLEMSGLSPPLSTHLVHLLLMGQRHLLLRLLLHPTPKHRARLRWMLLRRRHSSLVAPPTWALRSFECYHSLWRESRTGGGL